MSIIVGLEGVLCRHEWRQSLIESEGWEAYHAAAIKDAPNVPMVQMVAALRAHGNTVYCVTSRPDIYRQTTGTWMVKHGVLVDRMIMRGQKDFRTDLQLRTDAVDAVLAIAKEVLLAIDENEKACDVYRAAGIPTLQLTNPSNREVEA